MEKIVLRVSEGQDISFTGQLAAEGLESNKGKRISLYDTEKGNWLLAVTNMNGFLLEHEVLTEKSAEQLVKLLGYTSYAKDIYAQLGFDTSNKLDI